MILIFSWWAALSNILRLFDPQGLGASAIVSMSHFHADCLLVMAGFVFAQISFEAHNSKSSDTARIQGFVLSMLPMLYFSLSLSAILIFLESSQGLIILPDNWQSDLLVSLSLLQGFGLADSTIWNHPSWIVSALLLGLLAMPSALIVARRLAQIPWFALALAILLVCGIELAVRMIWKAPLSSFTQDFGALRGLELLVLGVFANLAARHFRVGFVRATFAAILGGATFAAAAMLNLGLPLAMFGFVFVIIGLYRLDRLNLSGPLTMLGEHNWAGASFAVFMLHMPLAGFAAFILTSLGGATSVNAVSALALFPVIIWACAKIHQRLETPALLKLHPQSSREKPQQEPPATSSMSTVQ